MTTSMRSGPTSAKHSIDRPTGVVRVQTVFGRTVAVAVGSAQDVTSFAESGSFGATDLGRLILLADIAEP